MTLSIQLQSPRLILRKGQEGAVCAQAQREGSETQSKQRGCTKSLSLEGNPD